MIPRSVNVDEKSTTNAGASSDSAKDLASTTTKENDEEKEEDEEEEDDGNTDEVQVTNHDENVATSGSKTEDTTSMTETGGSTAAPAPEMSNSTAVARLVWLHYTLGSTTPTSLQSSIRSLLPFYL